MLSTLIFLSVCYSNCSQVHYGSHSGQSNPPQTAKGGGGIDGKVVYANLGYCSGVIDIVSEIQIGVGGIEAYLIRDNCQNLASPAAIALADLNYSYDTQSVLIYKSKVFDLQTGQPHQRVTIELCQATVGTQTVQAAVWSTIEQPSLGPQIWGSVARGDGAISGPLTMTSTNGTDIALNSFLSDQGQLSSLSLAIPSGSMSYSLQGGATQTSASSSCSSQPLPAITLHYAPNANVDGSGNYAPAVAGFNLADIQSVSQLSSLPAGVQALIWLGMCNGADSNFINAVTPFIGKSGVYGFYLMDTPDMATCSASNLQAESDWIHANIPGAKTFIVLANSGSSSAPTYVGSYSSANTHVDLFGLNPYPCRSEFGGCQMGMIASYFNAAISAGIPASSIIPVFQSFGGGSYVDDNGGQYLMPTAGQEQQILDAWAALLPHPQFDFAYSWGQQAGDQSLVGSPDLQSVIKAHNSSAW